MRRNGARVLPRHTARLQHRPRAPPLSENRVQDQAKNDVRGDKKFHWLASSNASSTTWSYLRKRAVDCPIDPSSSMAALPRAPLWPLVPALRSRLRRRSARTASVSHTNSPLHDSVTP